MRITASAAASVSNLGPGYDVLGLCLESPRDRVTVERTDSGVVELVEVSGDGGRLPRVAEENCASIAAQSVSSSGYELSVGAPGLDGANANATRSPHGVLVTSAMQHTSSQPPSPSPPSHPP